MRLILTRVRLIWHAFGWRGIVRRLRYLTALRSGALARQLPVRSSFDDSPEVEWRHRFDLAEIRTRCAELPDVERLRERVLADAEQMLAGEMPFYGGDWRSTGSPPAWHRNPFTAHEYPGVHWTEISDADPDVGDIKDVWEMSRLPHTFTLARAYVLTSDDVFVESWWRLVEDWAAHNPPNLGVNWRCGQETSLRAISLCFGLSVFAGHTASTAERRKLAHRILGASVQRVLPTVGYALSQRNNHAVSELVFLLSVRARPDERQLLRNLLEVLDDQFYPDGSYAQQSFTYQRLAVQTLQWLLIARPDLPSGARSRVVEVLARSRDFLTRCSDPVSGWLPNYGPNDGALLFHLSHAHYRDFRPTLGSLGAEVAPEWREPAIWLEDAGVSAAVTSAAQAPTTYVTLRGPRSLAFSRIGSGRHRHAHGDQQAIDLWINGRNIVVDPGTYRYTAPAPWQNALTGPEVHALPHEGGASQIAVGRFLSEGMAAARVVHMGVHDDVEVLVSSRPAGSGAFVRTVVRRGDAYAVIDLADGAAGRVRWNVGEASAADVRFLPQPTAPPTPVPSEEDPASGWASELYAHRRPINVRIVPLAAGSVRIARFAPDPQRHLALEDLQDSLRRVATDTGGGAERIAEHLRSIGSS